MTNQELEDILRLICKKKLGKFDLKPALKQFASDSNPLLINYTKFKEAIIGRDNSSLSSVEILNARGQKQAAGVITSN